VTTHPTLRRLPPDFVDRLRDLLATVRSAQTLLASESDAEQLTRVVRLAVRQTDAAGGLLYVVDPDRNDLRIAAAVGAAFAPLVGARIGRTGLPGFAIDDGTPLAVASHDRSAPGGTETGHAVHGTETDEIGARVGASARSQLVAPVMVFGVAAGAIEVRDAPGERGFTPEDIEVVVELAHVAAAAVEAHRGERLLAAMFAAVLPGAMAGRPPDEELLQWIEEVRATPEFRRELALAGKLRALARDAAGIEMVEKIVDAVLEGRRR
jgi:GAF domain-containing protein